MSTPFTVSHPLGRVPIFPELQELAKPHEVQINGNDQAGDFSHPKANGKFIFEKDGSIKGDFTGQVLGIISGVFIFMTGKAEVTITQRPFLLPEAVLKSHILEGLEVFCVKFPPPA